MTAALEIAGFAINLLVVLVEIVSGPASPLAPSTITDAPTHYERLAREAWAEIDTADMDLGVTIGILEKWFRAALDEAAKVARDHEQDCEVGTSPCADTIAAAIDALKGEPKTG